MEARSRGARERKWELCEGYCSERGGVSVRSREVLQTHRGAAWTFVPAEASSAMEREGSDAGNTDGTFFFLFLYSVLKFQRGVERSCQLPVPICRRLPRPPPPHFL